MDAQLLSRRESPLLGISLATALVACLLLALLAGWFSFRRLVGGFAAPPTWPAFSAVALGAMLAIAAPRLVGARWIAPHGPLSLYLAFLILPAFAVLGFVSAFGSASLAPWQLALVWLCVAVEEAAWWAVYVRRRKTARIAERRSRVVAPSSREPAAGPGGLLEDGGKSQDAEQLAETLVLRLEHSRTQSGGESIRGILCGDFAAGERNQQLHVAFCPPLAQIPELLFEQVDGPAASIKAGLVETYGARLDVRLNAPAEAGDRVFVEFVATTPENLAQACCGSNQDGENSGEPAANPPFGQIRSRSA